VCARRCGGRRGGAKNGDGRAPWGWGWVGVRRGDVERPRWDGDGVRWRRGARVWGLDDDDDDDCGGGLPGIPSTWIPGATAPEPRILWWTDALCMRSRSARRVVVEGEAPCAGARTPGGPPLESSASSSAWSRRRYARAASRVTRTPTIVRWRDGGGRGRGPGKGGNAGAGGGGEGGGGGMGGGGEGEVSTASPSSSSSPRLTPPPHTALCSSQSALWQAEEQYWRERQAPHRPAAGRDPQTSQRRGPGIAPSGEENAQEKRRGCGHALPATTGGCPRGAEGGSCCWQVSGSEGWGRVGRGHGVGGPRQLLLAAMARESEGLGRDVHLAPNTT
jgi:hypothetical protein